MAQHAWFGHRRWRATHATNALHRFDGRPEAAPAGSRDEQSGRRNDDPVCVFHQVLRGRQAGRNTLDNAAAIPRSRGRTGANIRLRQPQSVRNPLCLSPWVLRWRGAGVSRLRPGGPMGYRRIRHLIEFTQFSSAYQSRRGFKRAARLHEDVVSHRRLFRRGRISKYMEHEYYAKGILPTPSPD